MLNLSPNAVLKIKDILKEENSPELKLRIFVQGGGCSGFQYGFALESDQEEDDFIMNFDDISVLVDSVSSMYLQGCEVDFKEDIMGGNFSISNPNAQTTCGCGSSFSIG